MSDEKGQGKVARRIVLHAVSQVEANETGLPLNTLGCLGNETLAKLASNRQGIIERRLESDEGHVTDGDPEKPKEKPKSSPVVDKPHLDRNKKNSSAATGGDDEHGGVSPSGANEGYRPDDADG
ncbi:MAG: hypothetical protein M1819_003640 [Sarea resinae]|nr:MAG: hypothetical protein M1819_003640 [Sarea resinae]